MVEYLCRDKTLHRPIVVGWLSSFKYMYKQEEGWEYLVPGFFLCVGHDAHPIHESYESQVFTAK